jgi:hypothetical protein
MGEIRAGLRSTGSAPKHIPCGLVGGRDCVVCAVIPIRGDLLRYGCIRMGRASWNPLRTDGALYRETRKRAGADLRLAWGVTMI